jgi:Rrf2 family protein
MRLSTKARYGVLAMVELAFHYGEGPMSIRAIAKKQNFSDSYLEQLFSSLKNAGLVKSFRGAHGGYLLARDPDKITVGAIIKALEGPIELADCVSGDDNFKCSKLPECVTRELWKDVQDSINSIIDYRTLKDLIKR